MGFIEGAKLQGKCFEDTVRQVCYFFQIKNLFEDQVKAIKAFLEENNVYFCASTGYGKSIVLDQVNKMNELGISSAAVFKGQDESILPDIEDGVYSLVFTSPESMLATKRWEKIWKSESFVDNCVCIAVDEAHCVSQWGLAGQKAAFRSWYGNHGVIRGLMKDVNLIVCTATATKSTKSKIFNVLELKMEETSSPDVFHGVILEVKEKNVKCSKTLIYCQTRKQAAVIWRTFKVELGKSMYAGETMMLRDCIVEMYHAGTPESSKKHILKSVCLPDGYVRVLICKIAFGMGIDIKGARKVIHFGPSQTTECYLQECGRVGRDGGILLYNGLLTFCCADHMKELINKQKCYRRDILKHFPGNHEILMQGCQCCYVCAQACSCLGLKGECAKKMLPVFSHEQITYQHGKHRTVTEQQKASLESKLYDYRDVLRSKAPKQVLLHPNVL
ncbi:Werner syndrome ATP-dependent helicase homolog [Dendronephthya gigantea]|uniref:Werner syndrome ATP-dependent helicase homolog n=1 Tax=Dendronephthya gigantea TaxID=151771 RepID=UPI00106B3001|nr:Werner syndrome ATP-dependent helicase homolog [Dendronephthya gigantea]